MRAKRYRTVRQLTSRQVTIAGGTEVRVIDKNAGLTIAGPRCDHCGIRPVIRRVQPGDLVEIT